MSNRACALAKARRFIAGVLAAVAVAEAMAVAGHEPLILEVSVNGRPRGVLTLYRDARGEFHARPSDLGVRAPSDDYASLRSLGLQRLRFDEARLTLDIELPAGTLEGREYDLAPGRRTQAFEQADNGGFVNYRLAASDESGSQASKLGLASEIALRAGGLLFRHESLLEHSAGVSSGVRLNTQLVHDRRADQQRFVLGDHNATSGELGSTLAVGGAGLFKVYSMTPYLIRQPLAGYAGTVTTPSLVEVRMGGATVFREQVGPGPFELKNLPNFTGARDVEVVMRDALGREQVISAFPYYFADTSLRESLHEYGYSVGALREDLGVRSNHYGGGVLLAFHRYGVNDRLTLGLRGEAASKLANFGPTAVLRIDRLGALSAGLALSEHEGRGGSAFSIGHVYQASRLGLHAGARRYSDAYAVAQDRLSPLGLSAEYGAGASFTQPGWGALYFDRTLTKPRPERQLPDRAVNRLSYSYNLGSRASFFATASWYHAATRTRDAFLGLLITFDRSHALHLNAQRAQDGAETFGAQLARSVPTGEGFGYRLAYETGRDDDAREFLAYAQYNARVATFTLEAAGERAGGMRTGRAEAAVAGAATWIGGRLGFTRPIDDSFVAVQLGAALEGVRVYSNNQEIGRTDGSGRLLVPQVGSYSETQIAIDERDVPLDYTFGDMRRVVAPPLRSGSLLRFDVRALRAVEGVIRGADNARVLLESGEEFSTGRDGRYYVEDLKPGRHKARVKGCDFVLDVPEAKVPIISLPEVTTCG